METRDNILRELKELAPTLAALEKKNFYTVPEGYFVNFKSEMLEQIKPGAVKQELKEIAPALLKVQGKSSVEVPVGYFTSFSANMLQKIRASEAAEELQAVAPTLATLQKENTMQVPANYFATFPAQMMKQITAAEKAKAGSAMPEWMQRVNIILENISAVVFKPRYSAAFAGMAAVLIMAVMLTWKVDEQCSDLDCKMAQLTDKELSDYLFMNTDGYQEEIFEAAPVKSDENIQVYKEAFKNISDEDLNYALLD